MSTKRSHIFKQTCYWKVCMAFLVDTKLEALPENSRYNDFISPYSHRYLFFHIHCFVSTPRLPANTDLF